jgi:hypothetical protein
MDLPFSRGQFFEVFRQYNEGVWPLQVAFYVLALGVVALLTFKPRSAERPIACALGFLWIWMALVYHGFYFTRITPAAYFFAALFFSGAMLFIWVGVIRGQLKFGRVRRVRLIVGAVLIVYALLVYPLLSLALGHRFPFSPTFGLPCPTTIFTIGVFAFAARPFPRKVLIVPVMWTVIGVQAAFLLGVFQDLALIVAGVFGIVVIATANRQFVITVNR